jgi:hypothetical protein
LVNDKLPDSGQRFTGQVRALFYLLDEPATTLTIQTDGQTITARAFGQVALDLRALPRGATICVTLRDAPPDRPQIIAFAVIPILMRHTRGLKPAMVVLFPPGSPKGALS